MATTPSKEDWFKNESFLTNPAQSVANFLGHGSPSLLLCLVLVVRQHALRTFNALTETVLKRVVTFTFFDMPCDRQTDHLGNRMTVDRCDRVQLLGLLGRKANSHCLDRFHVHILRLA